MNDCLLCDVTGHVIKGQLSNNAMSASTEKQKNSSPKNLKNKVF